MNAPSDFATILREHMARAVRANRDLAQLTGLALRSIENWTSGRIRRPRLAADVLKLARALDLDALEANVLLRTAGHPPLETLRAQASKLADVSLQTLLATWLPSPAEPTEPQIAVALRHQLRPPVADFVGREAEASRLVATLQAALEQGSGTVISGLHGMGGIGKTELAYLLAHRLRAALPDAQLVLNLRGSSAVPLSAVQALQTIIHALDPEVALEVELDSLQAHYRSALHAQRVLIIADDASDAAQVRPLLPPQGCVLLVTSRQRFILPGMLAIDLEVLAEDEAAALLRTLCERLQEADARKLARACGYLPLALRVSGSILQTNPALSPSRYIQQLADERQRLSQLRDPDDLHLDVAASLMLSYARLDAPTQTVFRQLGVLAAPFSTVLAQQMVAVPGGGEVVVALHRLLQCNLVMYDAERERWRLHDLVRALARRQLDAVGEAEAALRCYTRAAVALAEQLQEQYLAGNTVAVLARFDTERAHLDAARHYAEAHAETPDGDRLLLDIAMATRYIGLLRYDPRQERIPLWEGVRMAARRLGDQLGEGRALNNLGIAHSDLGEIQKAIAYYEQRLVIARAIGDRQGEGNTLCNLGLAYHFLGEPSKAISFFEQDLVIARELGERRDEALALCNLGLAHNLLGEAAVAISFFEQDLAIAHAMSDDFGEIRSRGDLALAYHKLGQLSEASTHYEQHLAISRVMDNRREEGRTLLNLGNLATDQGDTQRAIDNCEAALVILREVGARREEGYALSYLARAQAVQGDLAEAKTTFNQAVTLLGEIGEHWGVAECQWFYGMALAQRGQRERALPLLRAAVAHEGEMKHAQHAEHTALVARLEAGGPFWVEQPEQETPGRGTDKPAESSKPPAKALPLHKGLPESERAHTK